MKVPRVESKLRVFSFKITFSSQVYLLVNAFFRFILHDSIIGVTGCAYNLELFQVQDLRNNLNAIKYAAKEVSLRFLS